MTHMLTTEPSSASRVRAGAAYRARLAETASDLAAAQALRFEVFNLELDEGLVQSYDSGLDSDPGQFRKHVGVLWKRPVLEPER